MLKQESCLQLLLKSLEDALAAEVVVIDVKKQTSVTDYMIICNGRSSRHVKAIAEQVIEQMKLNGFVPLSQNGRETGEWVLIDFGDFVLHIMQPESRTFYNLEGLWHN